ncbi:polysaccharide pyruvyl transferase family protein [Micromonospora sp. WMMD1082]|uniref:polysaccharide pyruvyl transferase family protein n=1 Tax=Micromonospora sp. WMMD1082 TaxID=3016104 RepID=UPI002417B5A0|nr:polysaccharide pyruvyl transferase family protein [Micromonospora sp. WMMD1082]MDG4794678.1 polysaccharide pyruvyl transferase family protein [Micromonospora sp. WMMD1082]
MTRVLLRSAKDPFTPVSPELSLALYKHGIFGRNVGNLVFTEAVHKLISVPGTEVVSNSFLSERPGVDQAYVNRVNEEYDLFVVPLANAFRLSFLDNLKRLTWVIERLRIPVVVIGVGVAGGAGSLDNPFPPPTDELRVAVRRFVSAVLDKSASIGVRGEFTRAYLAELGFGDDVVDAVGCPSLFRDGPNLQVTKRVAEITSESRFTINISPYVKLMDRVATRHAKRYPNMVYVPQGDEVLELLLWGTHPDNVRRGLPHHTGHQLYREDRIRFFVDTSTWMRYLAEQEFSFGTRIHGNIVALSAGTPAHVLAHDSRTLELAGYHEIPHSLVPDVSPTVDAAELYAQADYTAFNAGQAPRWDRFARFLERNGIEHVFQPGKADPGYDARLAAAGLPPAVTTLMTTDPEAREQIKSRVAELYSLGGVRVLREAHKPQIPFPHSVALYEGMAPGERPPGRRVVQHLPVPVRSALRQSRALAHRLRRRA